MWVKVPTFTHPSGRRFHPSKRLSQRKIAIVTPKPLPQRVRLNPVPMPVNRRCALPAKGAHWWALSIYGITHFYAGFPTPARQPPHPNPA